MDEEKIFEALEKFPETVKKVDELADIVKNNSKVTSDSVKTVSSDVKGLETRMSQMEQEFSSLKSAVNTASTAMKKEVTVNVPPVTVRKGDVNITQTPLSDSQLETMAKTLAEKINNKGKSDKIILIILGLVIVFTAIVGIKFLTAYDNDYRGWGARYVEVGKVAGDLHPGDRFLYVKEEFAKGRKPRKAAKKLIEAEEEKYNDHYKSNARIMAKDLTKAIQEESVILDYFVVSTDSLGYEAFTIFRPVDKEFRLAAHLLKNGEVFINSDSDLVTAAEDAKKHPGRKTWKKMGNYKE